MMMSVVSTPFMVCPIFPFLASLLHSLLFAALLVQKNVHAIILLYTEDNFPDQSFAFFAKYGPSLLQHEYLE